MKEPEENRRVYGRLFHVSGVIILFHFSELHPTLPELFGQFHKKEKIDFKKNPFLFDSTSMPSGI
jgi:hypothetical protein